jgi:hypothetical protein
MKDEVLAGSGVRRLAAAMLIRAALDIRWATRGREVISWMNDPTEAEFSFKFCCRILDRDPRQVRGLLEQKAEWWLAKPAQSRFIWPRPAGRAAFSATSSRKQPLPDSGRRLAS